MSKQNWLTKFKEAYDNFPSQDNEGYTPDRGSFKAGFYSAWEMEQIEINNLKARLETFINALEVEHDIYYPGDCIVCKALKEDYAQELKDNE